MIIEMYKRFIEITKKHRDEVQGELISLGYGNLTRQERDYQNELMNTVKRMNNTISIAENSIETIKLEMELQERT